MRVLGSLHGWDVIKSMADGKVRVLRKKALERGRARTQVDHLITLVNGGA